MSLIFFGVLYGFGRGILVSILVDICILGTYSILFGSICLDAFWSLSLGLSMGFIFFCFFFLLSTQRTFDCDGHLLSIFLTFIFRFGSLTSPSGGKGLHLTFCCICGCSLSVTCN